MHGFIVLMRKVYFRYLVFRWKALAYVLCLVPDFYVPLRYDYDTAYPTSLGKNHEPFSLPGSPMTDAVNIVALYDGAEDHFYYAMIHDTIHSGSGGFCDSQSPAGVCASPSCLQKHASPIHVMRNNSTPLRKAQNVLYAKTSVLGEHSILCSRTTEYM